MSDGHAEAGHLQVIFHDDDDTPMEFVVEVLHSVFKKPIADALKFTEAIDRNGRAMCGTYPRDVASEMLEAARQHIRASGHPLLITSEAVAAGGENGGCKLCGALSTRNALPLKGMETLICDDCMYEITSNLPEVVSNKQFDYACDALAWHFAGIPRDHNAFAPRLHSSAADKRREIGEIWGDGIDPPGIRPTTSCGWMYSGIVCGICLR
jgi:ATP-dependent Clp protease adapter protein ClpS